MLFAGHESRTHNRYLCDCAFLVQVDQFRQNIEVTRATLLDQQNALKLALDNYKTLTLGLPNLRGQVSLFSTKQIETKRPGP